MIWLLKTQEHVRVFMWELPHNRVLTNAERFKKSLAPNGDCIMCDLHLEDVIHALRDCKDSNEVCHHLVPAYFSQKFFSPTKRMDQMEYVEQGVVTV